jgi:hypothetical protein
MENLEGSSRRDPVIGLNPSSQHLSCIFVLGPQHFWTSALTLVPEYRC